MLLHDIDRFRTDAVRAAADGLLDGRAPIDINDPLHVATLMTKVGEATGALPQMLSDVAEFYDEQVDESMTRMVSFFEPLLLVTMGIIIAFLLLAMYMPIFNLS